MRPRCVLMVLLAACANSPTSYERGTLTRPPPPPTRPGVGAPVMGQPGSATAPLPRSPNTRVLPPSTEPGLWSADSPKASKATEGVPVLYGIEMPVPEEVGAAAGFHAAMCAHSLEDATQAAGKARLVEGLSRQQKACLALQLQALCLVTVRGRLSEAKRGGLNALVDVTYRAMERECIGVAYGKGAMNKAFTDTGERWLSMFDARKWRLQ